MNLKSRLSTCHVHFVMIFMMIRLYSQRLINWLFFVHITFYTWIYFSRSRDVDDMRGVIEGFGNIIDDLRGKLDKLGYEMIFLAMIGAIPIVKAEMKMIPRVVDIIEYLEEANDLMETELKNSGS